MQKLTLTDKRGTSKVMELLLIEAPDKIHYIIDDDGVERYQAALLQSIQEGVPFKDIEIGHPGKYSPHYGISIDGQTMIKFIADELYDVPELYKVKIKEGFAYLENEHD